MAGGEREGDKGLEVGERWRWVSHCHPPPPSPLTFPPVLAPSPQWGWGRGWGLVRCPAGPPSPSAAQKAPLPPFGPRRSPAALRGGCSPCPDPRELLLLWGDPKRGCRRGMPVFGSPQPPALGSRRQQLRATRTHPTFSRELPPQAGNRAPLSGGDRAGGPGAPVPAHKEPLERAGTPWLKALRILQRPFDSGFVTGFFFFPCRVLRVAVPGWTFISAVETVRCWQPGAKSPRGGRRGGSPVPGVASPCAPSAGAPRAHPSRSASLRAPRAPCRPAAAAGLAWMGVGHLLDFLPTP